MKNRLLRVPEVLETIGFRKSWLYREVDAGRFPAPIYVGRIPLWRESDIAAWIEDRRARDPHNLGTDLAIAS